jgi:hypothetical protein
MKVPTVKVPRLVVRADSPATRRLLVLGLLLALVILLGVAFQWGRGNLGLPGGITADRVTLRDRVNLLEEEQRGLRVELARRETERLGQARERTELASVIGSLRADVQRLESELGFYRGVVGTAGAPVDLLKIQQFQVSRSTEPGSFRLRLVLGRPLNTDGNVSGRLRLTFEGAPGSTPARLGLAEVGGVQGGELPFDFRYLQEIEQIIRLPMGFLPARTQVELTPTRKGVNPVRETYPWAPEN